MVNEIPISFTSDENAPFNVQNLKDNTSKELIC